ncbi:hypothetical protein [Deinococcus arcticus]|uniref:DUF11 domain-containing protein n=1 Tax=Deinococcus arcticus TaxID=2136176 RepID=A0A2T3WA67_9DEIO|nr:hypothetical protein [Deinococcus arcticus]PTA68799.1 hypothetical protein C8263_06060 [Deinococcus arcticus]
MSFSLTQNLVRRSVTASGKTTGTLVQSPKTVQPGDVLSGRVTLRHVLGRPLRGVLANAPEPRGTTDSTRAPVQASVGGKTLSAASPTSTTNVNWTVQTLAPDETRKPGFRVKVN